MKERRRPSRLVAPARRHSQGSARPFLAENAAVSRFSRLWKGPPNEGFDRRRYPTKEEARRRTGEMTLCHGCVALRNDEARRQNAPATPGSVGEAFRKARAEPRDVDETFRSAPEAFGNAGETCWNVPPRCWNAP